MTLPLPLPSLAIALQNAAFITVAPGEPTLRIDNFDIEDGILLCHDENNPSSAPFSIRFNLNELDLTKVQLLRLIPLEFERDINKNKASLE